MNYRHAYHAGNFADVMKHIVLVRVIEHLKQKEKPFRFIDTHAGAGIYDLTSDAAARSCEWPTGIGAIVNPGGFEPRDVVAGSQLAGWLQPYFDILCDVNATADLGTGEAGHGPGAARALKRYPGAGEIARRLMRRQDRLVLNELHPEDTRALRGAMAADERVRTLEIDGWMAVKSLLPPKERRGLLLIDPPFELAGEFKRLEEALDNATSRFQTGVTLIWFPIKAGGAARAFVNRLVKSDHTRLLCAEVLVRHPDTLGGLNGSGLVIHNPPYELDIQLKPILNWLCGLLGQAAGASWDVYWLTRE